MRFRLLAVLAVVSVLAAGSAVIGGCGVDYIDGARDCTDEERQRLGCEGCPVTCDRDAGADADSGDAGDATMDEEDAGDAGG